MNNLYTGPIFNKTIRSFSTRDSLGIEGVATSISGAICDVVNTVTPKPYYWAFITWNYYDYYTHVQASEHKTTNVEKYIHKNNFYIALGNILANGHSPGGYVGQESIYRKLKSSDTSFSYDKNYVDGMSTMNYYPPGLQNLGLVITYNPDTGERYSKPRITPEGEKLALAFGRVISKTAYYQEYRFTDTPVPKNVLIELGNKIHYNLDGFDECKEILIQDMFHRERTRNLGQCQRYVSFIHETYHCSMTSSKECRRILYDMFSPRSENPQHLDPSLKEIADGWEIVIGRQYFTIGLEIIWKYMMKCLREPMDLEIWIYHVLHESIIPNDTLQSILHSEPLNFADREQIISTERRGSGQKSLKNGLNILLSVYNRFDGRKDISEENAMFFRSGQNNESISLNEFFTLVDQYKDQPVETFLRYIMKNYLILQHLRTAFNKMLRNVDGYYIEEIEGKLLRKADFSFDFQGIRMVQLYSVMTDLGLI